MATLDAHRNGHRSREAPTPTDAAGTDAVGTTCPPGTVPWPTEACEPLKQAKADALAFLRTNIFPFDTPNMATLFEGGIAEPTATLALLARAHFGWAARVPREIFNGYVLPYANVNEARTDWRQLVRVVTRLARPALGVVSA